MTQIREATQESVTTTKPQEFLYCILHEQMVKTEDGICGLGHTQEINTDEGKEIDFCCFEGGYAYCPPPNEFELASDWAAQSANLSDEERAQAEIEEMGIWK